MEEREILEGQRAYFRSGATPGAGVPAGTAAEAAPGPGRLGAGAAGGSGGGPGEKSLRSLRHGGWGWSGEKSGPPWGI